MAPEEQEHFLSAEDGETTGVDNEESAEGPGTTLTQVNDAPENACVDTQDNPNGPFFYAQDFENAEIRRMADAVDLFRHLGLQRDIELPQLVVIGEQSCGKSSLLESLTKLPFPVAANTCTRFPIEVILRRGALQEVQVSATQGSQDHTSAALDGFDHRYGPDFNAEKFTECLHDFSVRLGLPLPASADSNAYSSPIRQGIASDTLRVEAKNPTYNMLSFVDTPGLIQTGSTDISKDDAPKIQSLVQDLIKKKRTIIIVVQDARQSVENQVAFRLAEEVDPHRERTVGVLTKCDLLNDNTEQERAIQLARNLLRPLKNGYFIVRNRVGAERVTRGAISIDQGYNKEESLFSHDMWRGISPDRIGSRALRTRLAQLFAEHIRAEFPAMQREIVDRLRQSQTRLRDLGPPRTTFEQQKQYLHQVLRRYSRLTEDCIAGRNIDVIRGFYEQPSRILLQREMLKGKFLRDLEGKGCKYAFIPVSDVVAGEYDQDAGRSLDDARVEEDGAWDNETIYSWINRQHHLAPIPACCGLLSHELLLALFRHQIQPWQRLARNYISEIAKSTHSFVHHALKEVSAGPLIAESLRKALINAAEKVHKSAAKRVDSLFEGEKMRMDTSDPQFAAQCSSNRAIRLGHALSTLKLGSDGDRLDQLTDAVEIGKHLQNPHILGRALSQPRDTVYEMHDMLHAYYHFAERRFRDNVIQIADSLIFSAPSIISVFDADWVEELTPEDAQVICGEDAQTRTGRHELEEQIERFRRAIEQVGDMIPSCRLNLVGRDDIPESENRRDRATRSAFNVQSSSQNLSGSTLVPGEETFQVPRHFQTAANPTFSFEPISHGNSRAVTPRRARHRGRPASPDRQSSPSPSDNFKNPSSLDPSASTNNKGNSATQTGSASTQQQSQTASVRVSAVTPERSTQASNSKSGPQSTTKFGEPEGSMSNASESPWGSALAKPANLFGSTSLSPTPNLFGSTASSTSGTASSTSGTTAPSPFAKLTPSGTSLTSPFGFPAANGFGTTPSTPGTSSTNVFGMPAAKALSKTPSTSATSSTSMFGRPAMNELGTTPSTSTMPPIRLFGSTSPAANASSTTPGASGTSSRGLSGQSGVNGPGTA